MLQNWPKPIKGHNGPVQALSVIPEPGRNRVKKKWSCLVLSVVRPLTPEAGVFPCYIPIAGISESYLRNPSLGAMHTTSFDFFRCVIH